MNSRWARTVPLYGESVTRTLYKFARLMGSEYFYPHWAKLVAPLVHLVPVDFYEASDHMAVVLFDDRSATYETVKYRTSLDSKVHSKCSCGVHLCDHWFHPLIKSGIIATPTSLQLLHPQSRFTEAQTAIDTLFSNLMLRSGRVEYEGPHLMKYLKAHGPQSEIMLSKHESTSLVYNSLASSSTFKRSLARKLSFGVREYFRTLRLHHVNVWFN